MEISDDSPNLNPPSLVENTMYCWGQADNGELGLGSAHDQNSIIISPVAPDFPQSKAVKYGEWSLL